MMKQYLSIACCLSLLTGCVHDAPSRVPASQAHAEVTAPQILLLGEVHDSAAGHAARATLLHRKLEAGWRPAIAMEQFDTDQQAALDVAMSACTDADCVVARVITGKSGWNWAYYKPVIALALQYHLPLYAANLSRADAGKVVKDGFTAALPADLIARYDLEHLPSEVLGAQEKEVRDSHCGMLPESMVPAMAKAQIARDVVMAQTLREHVGNGIVLIAGNGHTRGDIAVAYWLRKLGLKAHSVGYLEPDNDGSHYDEVHRIPKTERPDPCAGFQAPTPAK